MQKLRNLDLIKLTCFLKDKAIEFDAPIWKELAKRMEKSKHSRCTVNISQINRYTQAHEVVTVPGKVLGSGILDHNVSVAAFSFSERARKRIEESGGECLTFFSLIDKNPKGENLKIIE